MPAPESMWSEEDLEAMWRTCPEFAPPPAVVRKIATLAVEFVAARGGTMTAEWLARAVAALAEESEILSEELSSHLAAQGARIATLEAELERYRTPRCQRQECARERERVDALEATIEREKTTTTHWRAKSAIEGAKP